MNFQIPGTAPKTETGDDGAPTLASTRIVDAANQGITELANQLDKESFVDSVQETIGNTLSFAEVSNLLDLDDGPGVEGEEETIDYIEVSYKHKTIAHFKVGPFIFKNHILTINGTSREVARKVEQFKDLWRDLMPQDRLNIKRIKNIQNEVGVDEDLTPRAVRGSVDTAQIADRQAGDRLTPQTPRPGAKSGFAARTLPFQVGR